MSDIYSGVEIKKLEPMRVASYQVISKNPEDEVINYVNKWLAKNKLDMHDDIRCFGFDVPVEEQKKAGLRGYEYWAVVTDSAVESDGVVIKNILEDEYAVLRITEPFTNPFETIPTGWKKLNEWVMNGEYKTTCWNNRYCLEEVIHDGDKTYMDLYFPVKDGGRQSKAEIINFQVKKLTPCKLIGKEIACKMGYPQGNPIPAFWGRCYEDGTMKALETYPDRLYPNASIGWMGNFNFKEKTFSYVVGVFVKPDAEVPEGILSIPMPETRYAVGTIQGTEPDIYMKAHKYTENEMKKAGLEFNMNVGIEMEWYDERFCKDKDEKVIDLYISVK